ncbi:hypothetical protein B6S12_06710 [Helicobacter valdiviensis]|uniref:Autotransporter domain-containing protein n=1 Tax=Helicobacter valdiviensis TaxID=1458358 RepID=A0A2W6MTU6_9HELI|nr:hypothetical protein [Helicobacter valdiviensis]PZT47924.1 hypothetical protein B6S12_06710 [Helicobacter valdiviensis]
MGILFKQSSTILTFSLLLYSQNIEMNNVNEAYSEGNPLGDSRKWFSIKEGQTYRGNTVTINADFNGGVAIGGYLDYASVLDNTLIVNGKVDLAIGGLGKNGATVNRNKVEINGSAKNAVGGYGEEYVRNNEVIVSRGSSVEENVIGGYSKNSNATYNDVEIKGEAKNVYAGVGLEVEGNGAIISGKVENLYGGFSINGEALNQFVLIESSGEVKEEAYSGYAKLDSIGNYLEISGKVKKGVGGYSKEANAKENSVHLIGEATSLIGGEGLNAFSNFVTIDGITQNAYSGIGKEEAHGNFLNLQSGKILGEAIGGMGKEAKGNQVFLSRGTEAQNVIAGKGEEIAQYNEVILKGEVKGDVIGGSAKEANYNLVSLYDNAKVGGIVYGGYDAKNNKGIDLHNSIFASGSASVGGLEGFDKLYLNASKQNIKKEGIPSSENTFILKINGNLDLSGRELIVSSLGVNSKEDIALIYAENGIKVDKNTLIHGNKTFIFETWKPKDNQEFEHELIKEDFIITQSLQQEAKSFPKSFSNSLMFLRNGGEVILNNMQEYSKILEENGGILAHIQGGKNKIDGSEFYGTYTNFGKIFSLGAESIGGLFFESGFGHFDNHIAASRGHTKELYVGVGGGIRHQFENGIYTQGYARGGVIESKFDSYYMHTNDRVAFKESNLYAGLGMAVGYLQEIKEGIRADFNFYSRADTIEGFSRELQHQNNDYLEVKNSMMYSLGFGSALEYFKEDFGVSVGIAYERIFSGGIESSINGFELETYKKNFDVINPYLALWIKPNYKTPLNLYIRGDGYFWDKRGVSGSVGISYGF